MDSTRQKKYSRLIQKDLGEIFQQVSRDHFGGAFITVTQVKVSPDLAISKVYLSFLMVKDKEALLLEIERSNKLIRQKLANRIRNQARIIPELHFYIDDTEEVASKVDSLFENLDIPPEDKEDDNLKDYKGDI
ncbi:30S ribosome-binding factor RbfA [Chondrinema litorale]|uniref:30S ribosome-binding factor RbfA n=1 Tax=Chondrinema litorale TaxID=2994555 RepID=UPI00254465C1|nr:30S ribosome-binding factor RbfA [Chondrinema litorale]UZR93323.1 30S ribosome-binding factor RbfA [Chondrinema litorale]